MRQLLWWSSGLCLGLGLVGIAQTWLQVACNKPGGIMLRWSGLASGSNPLPHDIYGKLQHHYFDWFFDLLAGELTLVNQGINSVREGMYTFFRELMKVRQKLVPMMPKWASSLITDWIALRTRAGVCWASGQMVWLSMRVWRAWQSSPSNIIFICLQPFCPGLPHPD